MIISSKFDKNSPIAFFDSGIGGLTVLGKVKKLLPDESFIYYGDTLNMPYGEKTKEQLFEYSRKIMDYFAERNCKAAVMACNTTSSVIYDEIKDLYDFKLYPIVQSVSKILAETDTESLGVFATRVTIESGAYQREIAKHNKKMKVYGKYCPKWVHIVEENSANLPENIEIIKKDLNEMMKNNPGKIVLGCTHYPFLTEVLSKFAPADLFIDPAVAFAEFIKKDLGAANLLSDTPGRFEEFYVSSDPERFKKSGKLFYDLETPPKLLVL